MARNKIANAVAATVEKPAAQVFGGLHTFATSDSTAQYSYTDEDVALVQKAFKALGDADKSVGNCAGALVRIFGEGWTKADADAELRKPVRDWLRAVLPEYQDLSKRRAQYAAAAKVGGVDVAEANNIRNIGRDVEARISRIIAGAAKAWQAHTAAQSDDYKAPDKKRKVRTASVILDDVAADLDDRAQKAAKAGASDAEAAKMAAAIVKQLPERAALFMAVMKAGARFQLSDAEMVGVLDNLSPAAVAEAQAKAKAKADAERKGSDGFTDAMAQQKAPNVQALPNTKPQRNRTARTPVAAK